MPRARKSPILLAVLVLAACDMWRGGPRPSTMAEEVVLDANPHGLRVTLVWEDSVDLDLYVTDPAQESVYFANPSSESGGRLIADIRCDTLGSQLRETIYWEAPVPGRYRIGADFIDGCESKREVVAYRIIAEVEESRTEAAGELKLERFEPIVLEIDVPGEAVKEVQP